MRGRRLTRYALITALFFVVVYTFLRYYSASSAGSQRPVPEASHPENKQSGPEEQAKSQNGDPSPLSLPGSTAPDTDSKPVDPPKALVEQPVLPPQSLPTKRPIHPVVHAPAAHPEIPTIPNDEEWPEDGGADELPEEYIYTDVENVHRKVFSVSTADKKYFLIVLGDNQAYNPNIIPHRTLNDTWILVAQYQEHSVKDSVWFAQWVCDARFNDDRLECIKPPTILPIAATSTDKCDGNLAFLAFNVGPHDARMFYGPKRPLVLYGSQSEYTCFGQWVHDFRRLVDWGFDYDYPDWFKAATEIQRPDKTYGRVEKNWFLFWDKDEEVFAHHDIYPSRVFAKLNRDGSVGPDLGPAASEAGDKECMAKYMPAVAEQLQSIHQSTNSLSITLCNRADPNCTPHDANTFIFTVFHHKSYYTFHSNYEPFIMMFHRTSPYQIYGIAQKPFWIHGRGGPGEGAMPPWITDRENWHQTEMFYITSMSWMKQGQTYHGYLDDVLFIAFGIEDSMTAGIDILAGELFKDLGLCAAAAISR